MLCAAAIRARREADERERSDPDLRYCHQLVIALLRATYNDVSSWQKVDKWPKRLAGFIKSADELAIVPILSKARTAMIENIWTHDRVR
jgi:hypothetical protein